MALPGEAPGIIDGVPLRRGLAPASLHRRPDIACGRRRQDGEDGGAYPIDGPHHSLTHSLGRRRQWPAACHQSPSTRLPVSAYALGRSRVKENIMYMKTTATNYLQKKRTTVHVSVKGQVNGAVYSPRPERQHVSGPSAAVRLCMSVSKHSHGAVYARRSGDAP